MPQLGRSWAVQNRVSACLKPTPHRTTRISKPKQSAANTMALTVAFIPEAERILPTRRGTSTVSGSKGNLLWAFRTSPSFRDKAIQAIATRRAGQLTDSAGCTTVTGVVTRLVGVLSPGGSSAMLEDRLYSRDYPTVKVQNISFKGHWLGWLVDHAAVATSNSPEAIEELGKFLTMEVSHLCGKRGCFTGGHTTLEPADINVSRATTCHMQRLTDLCPHQPPCIKTPAAQAKKKRRVA
ncbi:MAG: hypothetical protein J3K34DRAFT_449906 [Monoraphidium minutum]|nr:MAG: hypothetical protein J3K34DRAFT_449906 [Monoraphidium minutum]